MTKIRIKNENKKISEAKVHSYFVHSSIFFFFFYIHVLLLSTYHLIYFDDADKRAFNLYIMLFCVSVERTGWTEKTIVQPNELAQA